MNPTDKMMAWAQIGLSVLFILGTFIIIGSYELGYAKFSVDQQKDFSSTMNWLTGACLIIIYFWFQRQRTSGIPDTPMVIQTHVAPDGTKTTVSSPVNAPASSVPNLPTTSAVVISPAAIVAAPLVQPPPQGNPHAQTPPPASSSPAV
jgi:hypothetical protein